jgi:hypothetical protein
MVTTEDVLLHPLRSDSSELDATFEVRAVEAFQVVFHHKAGRRGSARSVNADYHDALEVVLERLIALRVTILAIAVDSSVARELPAEERELKLEYPIHLRDQDPHLLRLAITRAQKPVARRADAKPGGGNDQKRIVMTIIDDQGRLTASNLRTALVRG